MLISHEVVGVVTGTDPKPASPAEDATHAIMAEYEKQLKEFTKKEGIAQNIIVTSMERRPLTHILNCSSAKEI